MIPPNILDVTSFEKAIDFNDTGNLQIILHEKCRDKIRDIINKVNKTSNKVKLFIGPEGGFTKGEVIKAKTKGFIPIGLGPRILRTETASIVAITVMQFLYGDI
jgi:16S rRNA (uracil1498-N3)-methyltransferase